ncbi:MULTISPECIES: META domain-containing protein [unclassified Caballeronia]|uniref:META domain-containing protein n=1 Tax=unclassified Caballeronia TaxID=2646786 RepID=UPI0028594114|nr:MULTISPECIES: META domain-containing protein [unclassified Caballeronia]MDR5812853.1 META domain-containing protein [Caballeronia sp. LZ033]MDR5819705.1 META domain-containing protein [Caballeronia sp. LZ043]MDR5877474.1 META domain-containing protein [Caballeronia sp. LZ032]
MPTSLFRASTARPSSRFLSRITRTAAGAGAALVVASLVAGCAIPKHSDASAPPTDPYNPAATQLLDDTQWQLTRWTDANGQTRAVPGEAQGTAQTDAASASSGQPLTLDFSTASGRRRASGFAGCNRFAGTYDLKDGKLSFGPLAGTRMACPGGTGAALEQPYLDGLAHVAKSGVQMNPPQSLQLTLEDGQVLVFAPRAK